MKTYPKIIKNIKRGNIELNHYINLDELGFERDFFELTRYNPNGGKSMLLFLPMPVVNYQKRDGPIKFTKNYTDKDYRKMFDENITKFL